MKVDYEQDLRDFASFFTGAADALKEAKRDAAELRRVNREQSAKYSKLRQLVRVYEEVNSVVGAPVIPRQAVQLLLLEG